MLSLRRSSFPAPARTPFSAPHPWARRAFCLPLSLAILVLLVPLIVDLVGGGRERPFSWVAPDTFYYLVYAQRTLTSGVIGYDGQFWSNGFHPLWMALVTLVQAVQPRAGTYVDLYFLLGICATFQAAALFFFARLFRRNDGSLSVLFALFPVGLYAILISPFWLRVSPRRLREMNPWQGGEPLHGTSWSFLNGMESSLTIFCFALLLWGCCTWQPESNRRHALGLGALLAALTFARLDHFFIALPLWFTLVLRSRFWKDRVSRRHHLWLTFVFVGSIAVYLLANHLLFGSFLPVSGRIKTTAPFVTLTNFQIWAETVNLVFGGNEQPIWLLWRALQSFVPVSFALISPFILFHVRRRGIGWSVTWARAGAMNAFLLATAAGVLLLATYDFLYVPPTHTGFWYFPVSITFVTLLGLNAAERARDFLVRRFDSLTRLGPRVTWVPSALTSAAFVAAAGWLFVRLHHHDDYNRRYADFYFQERTKIRETFRGREPHLYCVDDGIVAYVTGFPAMSGTALAIDAAALPWFEKNQLVQLAQQRGFDHLTSLIYVDHAPLRRATPDWNSWNTRAFGNLDPSRLELVYISETVNFAIVRLLR